LTSKFLKILRCKTRFGNRDSFNSLDLYDHEKCPLEQLRFVTSFGVSVSHALRL